MGLSAQNKEGDNDEAVVIIADGQSDTGTTSAKVEADGAGDKRLFVDAKINVVNDGAIPTVGNGLRYKDMNVSTGGVARGSTVGATFVDLYDELGAGILLGFVITLETPEVWDIRILIDSVDITDGGIALSDMNSSVIYDLNGDFQLTQPTGINMWLRGKAFVWNSPSFFPIRFDTRVQIQAQNPSSEEFNGGLVSITGT